VLRIDLLEFSIHLGDWSVQTSSKFKFSPSGENDVDDKKIKKFYLDDEVIEILGPMEISLIPGKQIIT